MKTRLAAVMSSLVICGALLQAQGLYWETTTKTEFMGGRERQSKSYFMPNMFKEVSDNNSVIIRLDQQKLYIVDPKEKTYAEMTFDELEKMAKEMGSQMNPRMKEMQERMKDMPEEQRKMMEKMMGDRMAANDPNAKVDVKETGDSKTLLGYACKGFTVTSGERNLMTVYATKDVPGYAEIGKELKDFGEKLAAMNPQGGRAMVQGLKTVAGFPLMVQSDRMTRTVTKLEKQTTPAAEFAVPEGFTKTDASKMMMRNGPPRPPRKESEE